MSRKLIIIFSFLLMSLVLVTQVTFFVIQPIGVVPEGRTLVMLRMNKTELVDSADGVCEREMGGVSLLCRAMVMSAIVDKGTVLLKLPYSSVLYNFSTDGKVYDR